MTTCTVVNFLFELVVHVQYTFLLVVANCSTNQQGVVMYDKKYYTYIYESWIVKNLMKAIIGKVISINLTVRTLCTSWGTRMRAIQLDPNHRRQSITHNQTSYWCVIKHQILQLPTSVFISMSISNELSLSNIIISRCGERVKHFHCEWRVATI